MRLVWNYQYCLASGLDCSENMQPELPRLLRASQSAMEALSKAYESRKCCNGMEAGAHYVTVTKFQWQPFCCLPPSSVHGMTGLVGVNYDVRTS